MYGVRFRRDKPISSITNCRIRNSTYIGVFVDITSIARITLTNNDISGDPADRYNIMNVGGEKCVLMVDGSRLPTDPYYLVPSNVARTVSHEMNQLEEKHGLEYVLIHQKAMKRAGFDICIPTCEACQVPEPSDVKYSKCSGCQGVVYCSKECQLTHWQEYKITCGVKLKADGPVIPLCEACKTPESVGFKYLSCGKCLDVV